MTTWQRQIPLAVVSSSHAFFPHACTVHQFHILLDGQ